MLGTKMSTLIKKNVSVKTEKIEKTYFTITKKKWRLEEQHLNSKIFYRKYWSGYKISA